MREKTQLQQERAWLPQAPDGGQPRPLTVFVIPSLSTTPWTLRVPSGMSEPRKSELDAPLDRWLRPDFFDKAGPAG